MTPEELGAALVGAIRGATVGPSGGGGDDSVDASVSGGGRWARATLDVPVAGWRAAVSTARDEFECDFFDWLSAVDEGERGIAIVAHLWSTRRRHGVLLRTLTPADAAAVDSL